MMPLFPNPSPTPQPTGSGPANPSPDGPEPTSYLITIPGVPVPQGRPRVVAMGKKCLTCGKGKFIHVYSPKQKETRAAQFELKNQWRRKPLEGPLELEIHFGMPIPKSTPKYKLLDMQMNEIKHTKKPDLDNLIKFYKDAMNKIVYNDDSQVWKITSTKQYVSKPFITIKIIEGSNL